MQNLLTNPDQRPLPPNWSTHLDTRTKFWFYVNLTTVPPRVSFTHPDDEEEDEDIEDEDETLPSNTSPPNQNPGHGLEHVHVSPSIQTSNSRPAARRPLPHSPPPSLPVTTPFAAIAIAQRTGRGPSFAQQLYASARSNTQGPYAAERQHQTSLPTEPTWKGWSDSHPAPFIPSNYGYGAANPANLSAKQNDDFTDNALNNAPSSNAIISDRRGHEKSFPLPAVTNNSSYFPSTSQSLISKPKETPTYVMKNSEPSAAFQTPINFPPSSAQVSRFFIDLPQTGWPYSSTIAHSIVDGEPTVPFNGGSALPYNSAPQLLYNTDAPFNHVVESPAPMIAPNMQSHQNSDQGPVQDTMEDLLAAARKKARKKAMKKAGIAITKSAGKFALGVGTRLVFGGFNPFSDSGEDGESLLGAISEGITGIRNPDVSEVAVAALTNIAGSAASDLASDAINSAFTSSHEPAPNFPPTHPTTNSCSPGQPGHAALPHSSMTPPNYYTLDQMQNQSVQRTRSIPQL